mmetsp:Transcript_3725/g.8288  ORF Transcript_3725/g.8288 Transcript_3725/m.8288 type:complete len:792 (+) Transcript_3725:619-2994(+)
MMHIYAQALYRLGETREADAVYRQLLGMAGDDDGDPAMMDADEREDALANALANRTANYTPGSLSSSAAAGGGAAGADDGEKSWLEEDDTLRQLLASYGTNKSSSTDKNDMLQNYDLAYNLATYLLVSSDARGQSHVLKAKHLLEHAESSALTVLESSSTSSPEDETDEDEAATAAKETARKKQKQQQLQLAEREAGPIRANLALAKLLLGGDANEMEALRGYLTLVTKAAMSKKKGGGVVVEANLMATASNNLALLRDGKESVFDVIKRIPTTSSLSVSEDHVGGGSTSGKGSNKGGKDKGGAAAAAMVPLVGATPQQVRIALFNRALLFAKMGNATGCLETLDVLRASLLLSYHGDGGDDGKKNSEGGSSTGGGGSPKRAKGKKKKLSTSVGGSGGGRSNVQDVPTAKPASDAEAIAWNARADWLESELLRISETKDGSPEDILNNAIAKLDKASKNQNDEACGVLSFTKSQLLLHKAVVNNPQSKAQLLIEALESLPSSVQSCPGTIVTLASLHGQLNNKSESVVDKLLSSLGDGTPAKLAMAEFRMERGQYDDAVELLQGIVEGGGDDALSMEATALLVKALSYTDPSKAEEYVELLQQATGAAGGGSDLDGEALESMDVPRFAKKALDSTSSGGEGAGSSSKVRKMIVATGGKGRSNLGERKKKNREAILRKRAKQREAHLSHLESTGHHDPNKTPLPKPDPERWIPKNQRSYNRRGRGRGRYKSNSGAQGGGAGAGMEKDAAKLDVAARVAAAKSTGDGFGTPSTANIKVSSSGAVRKGKGGKRR